METKQISNPKTFLPKELNSTLYKHISDYCNKYNLQFDGSKIISKKEEEDKVLFVDYYVNNSNRAFLLVYNEVNQIKINLRSNLIMNAGELNKLSKMAGTL